MNYRNRANTLHGQENHTQVADLKKSLLRHLRHKWVRWSLLSFYQCLSATLRFFKIARQIVTMRHHLAVTPTRPTASAHNLGSIRKIANRVRLISQCRSKNGAFASPPDVHRHAAGRPARTIWVRSAKSPIAFGSFHNANRKTAPLRHHPTFTATRPVGQRAQSGFDPQNRQSRSAHFTMPIEKRCLCVTTRRSPPRGRRPARTIWVRSAKSPIASQIAYGSFHNANRKTTPLRHPPGDLAAADRLHSAKTARHACTGASQNPMFASPPRSRIGLDSKNASCPPSRPAANREAVSKNACLRHQIRNKAGSALLNVSIGIESAA